MACYGPLVALGQSRRALDGAGWIEHGEVAVVDADEDEQHGFAVSPDGEDALALVDWGEHSLREVRLGAQLLDGRVHQEPSDDGPGLDGQPVCEVGLEPAWGRFAGSEAPPVWHLDRHSVNPVGAPGFGRRVPANEVPASTGVDKPVRFRLPAGELPIVALVVKPQQFTVADGTCRGGQDGRIHQRCGGGDCADRFGQAGDPSAKRGGQNSIELGQCPQRWFLNAAYGTGCGGLQSDRDRDRLLVVEEQWRQLGPGPESVTAGNARCAVDRIAKVAEALHVLANSAGRHLELAGEFGAGDVTAGLEEREKLEQPGGGASHEYQVCRQCGTICSLFVGTLAG